MIENLTIPNKLNTDIYLDGADLEIAKKANNLELIKGFTSNPSLMHKNNISSYDKFVKEFLSLTSKPVSFEVVSDDLHEMKEQAVKLSSYGKNVYVKIPVTNTKGEETKNVIKDLTNQGIKINVTAIFTINQIQNLIETVEPKSDIILSIFAGRIADTGRDPEKIFYEAKKILINKSSNYKLLWASVREVYNIYQASNVGSHIVTVTPDILKKLKLMNKDLTSYSLETVKMFYEDAQKGNLKI